MHSLRSKEIAYQFAMLKFGSRVKCVQIEPPLSVIELLAIGVDVANPPVEEVKDRAVLVQVRKKMKVKWNGKFGSISLGND